MTERKGIVVAVCLNPDPGIPKHPQPQVTIGPEGIEGDFHTGPIARHAGRNESPNRRQITVVAQEVFDDLKQELGVDIPPGGFGENVLIRGLGDLSDLKEGDVLRFSSGVELEVTGQNTPCQNLMRYHPQVPKRVHGKRGVVAVVRRPGVLRASDSVEVDL